MADEWAILATGESMTQGIATSAMCYEHVIVISDAYRLAPWAFALVSQDRAWWKAHPDAKAFAGRRFSVANDIEGVESLRSAGMYNTSINSGLLGCMVAQYFGAKKIDLYGFDMHGSHFFGPHPSSLKNTKPERFTAMIEQFERWNHDGIDVINYTPNSALTCFREPCNA